MIGELKNILGITGNQFDLFLTFICCWIVCYFLYLLTNILVSSIHGWR